MKASLLTREIAEQYLDEMIEAERHFDYKAWCRRWEDTIYKEFPKGLFTSETRETFDDLGQYLRREYIGCETNYDSGEVSWKRFVWKSTCEKGQCVITVGIHEVDGTVYLNEEMYRYGESNMCMFLLRSKPGVSQKTEHTHSLNRAVAEQVLDEMLEAKKTSNYDAWNQRWEVDLTANYTKEKFLNNIKGTLDELGHYISREYIGCISYEGESGKTYSHAWKSQYEKNVAITTVGIYEKESIVYLDEIWTSYGDDHLYFLLFNYDG